MSAHVVNLHDRPDLESKIERPGGARATGHKSTRFLGLPDQDFVQPTEPPVEYGAGTLTWVEAGTIYGYTVLEDAKILILFERSPGMNYR